MDFCIVGLPILVRQLVLCQPDPTPEEQTAILSLKDDQPQMLEELIRINTGFDNLRNPLFRNTMARVASIETAAGFMGMDAEEALEKIVR